MEHRNLTGDALHEPKGIETASNGSVYVANGSGSGSWVSSTVGTYYLSLPMSTGTAGSSNAFFVAQAPGKLTRLAGVLSYSLGSAIGLTVYKNGTAQTPTWSFNGTAAAGFQNFNIDVIQGDVIEVRVTSSSSSGPNMYVTAKFSVS